MSEELIKYYMLFNSNKTISKNVGIDNVIPELNKIFKNNWTYEIVKEDYDSIEGLYLLTIVLYMPGKVIPGAATIDINKVGLEEYRVIGIKTAVKNAYDNCIILNEEYKASDNVIQEKEIITEDIKETKKEVKNSSLDELEEEMKDKKPVDKLTIRKDQIDFINNFKIENNINTEDKFNYCVKTFGENSNYHVYNKRELIKAGAIVLDEFISWIKKVQVSDIISQNIISPI